MIINILSLGKFKVNQKFKSIFEYYQSRIKFKTVLIELKTYENNIEAYNILQIPI